MGSNNVKKEMQDFSLSSERGRKQEVANAWAVGTACAVTVAKDWSCAAFRRASECGTIELPKALAVQSSTAVMPRRKMERDHRTETDQCATFGNDSLLLMPKKSRP